MRGEIGQWLTGLMFVRHAETQLEIFFRMMKQLVFLQFILRVDIEKMRIFKRSFLALDS